MLQENFGNILKQDNKVYYQDGETIEVDELKDIKVNGKRMCDLVRSGRADEINLKIQIDKITCLVIRYVCSTWTRLKELCL